MKDRIIDKLVMLLSTDWFFDHWKTIGIELVESKRREIQHGCRSIVGQIIGTAKDYWHISFSTERLHESESLFRNLLQTSISNQSVLSRFDELIAASNTDEESSTSWAFLHITELIILNSDEAKNVHLDKEIKNALAGIWKNWETMQVECDNLTSKSRSAWDRYIMDLTPDQPRMLCDYLNEGLIGRIKYKLLLRYIHSNLTPSQRDMLFKCFRGLSRSLGMEGVVIPPTV